jgi:HJR/Mrr/RecB family endonuclease
MIRRYIFVLIHALSPYRGRNQIMWEFKGIIKYTCNNCYDSAEITIEDFDVECISGSERGMGRESIYELLFEFECAQCKNDISLSFEVSEYPAEILNHVINNSSGAKTEGEPEFEYLPEIYEPSDLLQFSKSVSGLMPILQNHPDLVTDITPRQFEEVIAEIFKSKGFEVKLTKRTRDGGKDIIAILTDALGVKNKYFIECKHNSKDNKVGVGLVRTLYGVKNTKDGPNKVILVTTSTFSIDAKKFVKNETASKWDITLADYDEIIKWLKGSN